LFTTAGQPFSYAGDTTLTAVQNGDGDYYVKVDRLYGNEVNDFTMVNIRKNFPASPPAETPALGASTDPVNKLPIPYAFSDMGGITHPSVNTEQSVFFTVNPSVAMFKGFAKGCLTGGQEWSMQLSALSSYAPIRIWKIDPYTFCPLGDDGTKECAPGHVDFRDIPGAFTETNNEGMHIFDIQKCTIPFAVAVTSLEYINAENIAVTVLHAPFSEYDAETGLLMENAVRSHYEVLFLSTVSMALSTTPHNRDVLISQLSQGMICPAMRRLPNMGSIWAELSIMPINLVRPIVSIIVSMPGLAKIWGEGRPCALSTSGHSVLQKCGAGIFSLEDFFESFQRANNHIWIGVGLVASQIRGLGEQQVADVVDGIAYYGQAATSPITTYIGVMRGVRIPVDAMGKSMMGTMFVNAPRFSKISMIASSNPLRMARFTTDLVAGCVADIIPLSVRIDKFGDKQAARDLIMVFVSRLYEFRKSYSKSISRSTLAACHGLSLMVGYDNPWAKLLRNQCEAVPIGIDGLMGLVSAIAVEVPVAKCLCVDARKAGNFRKYAMSNCFWLVPLSMKPTYLSLIENSMNNGDEVEACSILVNYVNDHVKHAMDPWFAKMFQVSDAMASSFDYLLKYLDPDAGHCTDFENDPFAMVLIPEPYDYFASCGSTTLCSIKCGGEIRAFDEALMLSENTATRRVQTVQVESLFFNDLDEDSLMPMKIVTMVELSTCTQLCGQGVNPMDRCMAIAGISSNESIAVMKFCIPSAKGLSVRSVKSESWNVWYSDKWSKTATDIQFADSIDADTLIVMRDGRGMKSMVYGPDEQFVTVHPRFIQAERDTWISKFMTDADRLDRLLIAKTSSTVVGRGDTWNPMAMTDMFVFPRDTSGRDTWIAINMVVDTGLDLSASQRVNVCVKIDPRGIVYSSTTTTLRRCDIGGFFDINRDLGYTPVLLPSPTSGNAQVMLIPTRSSTNVCPPLPPIFEQIFN
jgi:hypothetical protein